MRQKIFNKNKEDGSWGRYQYDGIVVTDRITPVENGLFRTLRRISNTNERRRRVNRK